MQWETEDQVKVLLQATNDLVALVWAKLDRQSFEIDFTQ